MSNRETSQTYIGESQVNHSFGGIGIEIEPVSQEERLTELKEIADLISKTHNGAPVAIDFEGDPGNYYVHLVEKSIKPNESHAIIIDPPSRDPDCLMQAGVLYEPSRIQTPRWNQTTKSGILKGPGRYRARKGA